MSVFKYHVRSLIVRWQMTLASAAGIALVACVIAATLMMVGALRKSTRMIDRADTAIVIRASADGEFSSSILDSDAANVATKPGIAQQDGLTLAHPELVVAATLPTGDGGRANVQLRGVGDDVTKVRPDVEVVEGRAPRWSAGEVMIGERLRGKFPGFELGGTFALRKSRTMTVVGVFRAGAAYDSEVWLARDLARSIFGREGRVSSVFVRLQSNDAFIRFKAALEQDKRLGVQALRERDYFENQTEGRANFVSAMGFLVGMLFGVGAMIGAMITMFAAIESRQREVGTMRAIGFSRLTILTGFLLEASVVALGAGLAGCCAAAALALRPFTMLDLTTRAEVVLELEPTPQVIVSALMTSLIMGIGGALLPAWRASRLSVIAALRA